MEWRPFGRALDHMFASEQRHAIGHITLFALLGLALLLVWPQLRSRPWRYFGLILIVGIGQEAFQLAFKQRAIVLNDFTDLLIDLIGAALAFGVVYAWTRWRQQDSVGNIKR
jgi:glycopeptide antibiotics resistance protein